MKRKFYLESYVYPIGGGKVLCPWSEYKETGEKKFAQTFERCFEPVSFLSPEEALEYAKREIYPEALLVFNETQNRILVIDGNTACDLCRITTDID